MIQWLLNFFSGGMLGRVLDTVDRRIDADTDREKLKADIIKEHYRSRADYMKSGGFWLMLMFAVGLAFWFNAVLLYSVFWCQRCLFPQNWSIAALPPPLDEWAGLMIAAIFGVVGLSNFRK